MVVLGGGAVAYERGTNELYVASVQCIGIARLEKMKMKNRKVWDYQIVFLFILESKPSRKDCSIWEQLDFGFRVGDLRRETNQLIVQEI